MPRKTSRRSVNYSKQNDEQQSSEIQEQQPEQKQYQLQQSTSNNNKTDGTDSLIADMAQGFIQAQAKIADNNTNVKNLEFTLLLQKLSEQLDDIKTSNKEKSNTGQEGMQNKQSPTKQDSEKDKPVKTPIKDSNSESTDVTLPENLKSLLASILRGKTENPVENNTTNPNKEQQQQPALDVQTVSQVLAQAQYELANELEISLKKLKQVISDSEKLVTNISNLLGEESKKKS